MSVNDFEAASIANFYREAPEWPEEERMFILRRYGDDCRSSFSEIQKTCPRIAGAVSNYLCLNHEIKNMYGRLTTGLSDLLGKEGKLKRTDFGLTDQRALEITCGVRGALKKHSLLYKSATCEAEKSPSSQPVKRTSASVGRTIFPPTGDTHAARLSSAGL